MNRLLIICLILLLQFHSISSKHEQPTIYPKKEFIIVESGTNLTLGCIGKEPVKWKFRGSTNEKVFTEKNTIIIEKISKSVRNNSNYKILITVVNVSPRNVGFYYCHGKTVPYTNWIRSKKIFVYVRDKNQLSLFPNGTYESKAQIGDIVVIPCLPTSPDVNVSLSYTLDEKTQNVSLYSTSKINRNKFPKGVVNNFLPMYGLTLDQQNYKGTSHCLFERNDIVEKFYFTMKFESPYRFLKPHIEGADINVAQLGENFSLNCTAILNPGMLLIWSYPNTFNPERISITESPRVKVVDVMRNQFGSQLVISTLNIKNATIEDGGKYRCKLNNLLYTDKFVDVVDKRIDQIPKIVYPKEKEIHVQSSKEKQIQINATENIELICLGLWPIRWRYPTFIDAKSTSLYYTPFWKAITKNRRQPETVSTKPANNIQEINRKELRNGTYIYKSVLKLKSASNWNTGLYLCHGNTSVLKNPYTSDAIYMFVKDPKNLQVDNIVTVLPFVKNTNETVPCRSSSPDVKVSLKLRSGELISADYDPRSGFTVNMVFDNNNNVHFLCYFELDGHKEKKLSIWFHIPYFRYETYTYLVTPKDNIAYLGDELILYCRVLVASNNFQIPIWVIPNSNRTINHSNIVISSISIDRGKVVTSKLTIKNIQYKDEGEYECYLPGTTDTLSRTRAKYINVYDKFDTKPSIDGFKNNASAAYFGSDMVLSCSVEVDHNFDFIIRWSLPNNGDKKNINSVFTKLMYIPTVYGTLGKSSLKMKNITFENQGNYTCRAVDSFNNEKIVAMDVIVKNTTKPRITVSNMNDSTMILTAGQSVAMFCSAEGNPAPKIMWKKGHTIISTDNNTLSIPFLRPSDSGLYTCNASTYVGWDMRKIKLNVPIANTIRKVYISIMSIVFLSIIIVFVSIIVQAKKQRALRNELIEAGVLNFETGKLQSLNPNLNIVDQALLLPYDRKWDIPRDRIKLGNELGSGYYGVVLQGEVFGIFRGETIKTVAVKMVKQNSDYMRLNALISELKLMTHIGKHINVVNLLGACTENINTRQLLVIVEYCKYGNVQNYLLQNRDSFIDLINSNSGEIESKISKEIYENNSDDTSKQISTLDLVSWSFQIARGMTYLASRKILHGDLAARNILLSDDSIVKISDFGLSKNMRNCKFYKKKNNKGPMPIKWMAIEAIRDGISTTQSDVWSFGIVLWELFSLGRTPYPEMEADFKFFRKISEGYRMEPPQYATKELYKIMLECWNFKPVSRPTFTELVEKFKNFLQKHANGDYMEMSNPEEDQNIPDFFSAVSSTDYLSVMSNKRNMESTATQELVPMVTIK